MYKKLFSFCALCAIWLIQMTASAATLSVCAQPEWPREALRYELEGDTTLEFKIDRGGHVVNLSVQKSSGWKLLDDAAMSSLSKCTYRDINPSGDFSVRYEWRLDSRPSMHQVLVPGSCRPSDRFQAFKGFDQHPSDRSGILMRFIVKAGQAEWIVPEANGQAPELVDPAIEYVKTCRFAFDSDVKGAWTDTMFGRVILK